MKREEYIKKIMDCGYTLQEARLILSRLDEQEDELINWIENNSRNKKYPKNNKRDYVKKIMDCGYTLQEARLILSRYDEGEEEKLAKWIENNSINKKCTETDNFNYEFKEKIEMFLSRLRLRSRNLNVHVDGFNYDTGIVEWHTYTMNSVQYMKTSQQMQELIDEIDNEVFN